MRVLCAAVLTFLAMAVLPSCRMMASATREEKSASMKRYGGEWTLPGTVRHYALQRSVQMMDPLRTRIKDQSVVLGGDVGMASIITADGYALTAAHVVEKPALTACFVAKRPDGTVGTPVHAARLRLRPEGGGKPFSLGLLLRYDTRGREPAPVGGAGPVLIGARVVKIFRHHDLALLKLPLTKAAHFDLPDARMAPGTVLFTPGNLLGFTPEPAAGQLNSLRTGRGAALTLFTTVPLAPGDSGGPVIDASGKLAGVASRAWPRRYFPLFPASEMTSLGTEEIKAAIAADRAVRRAIVVDVFEQAVVALTWREDTGDSAADRAGR